MLQEFHYPHPFVLESGKSLPEITIAYHTYGTLNAAKDNVVWICHALTANSDAVAWWPGMVGADCSIDPSKHFIVCANILGSCYGTTGPLSTPPDSSRPYFGDFPFITIRDMVQAHVLLRRYLGIDKIFLLVGGSMGGYQAQEWAVLEPEVVQNMFLLATSASESAWGIAIHAAQRLAIEADGTFGQAFTTAGIKGLKAARAIGMLTYRNYELFVQQQSDADSQKKDGFKAASYMDYQGEKLVHRFNAYSYWLLTKALDSHNLARGRTTHADEVLATISQPTLLIGIASDLLCPVAEQRQIAAQLPNCQYLEIDSNYGHDGFLTETEKIGGALRGWMKNIRPE